MLIVSVDCFGSSAGFDRRDVHVVAAPERIVVGDAEACAVEIGAGDAGEGQEIVRAAGWEKALHRDRERYERVAAAGDVHAGVRRLAVRRDVERVAGGVRREPRSFRQLHRLELRDDVVPIRVAEVDRRSIFA